MTVKIERVEYGEIIHNSGVPLYDDEWNELQILVAKLNPIDTLFPVRHVYRAGDFYRFIMLVGIEKIKNMSDQELEERGL